MESFKDLFTESKLDEGFVQNLLKKFKKEKDSVPTSMSVKEVVALAKKGKATRTIKIPGIDGITINFDTPEAKKSFIQKLEDNTYNDIGATTYGPCVIVKFESDQVKSYKSEIFWKGQYPKARDPYDFD